MKYKFFILCLIVPLFSCSLFGSFWDKTKTVYRKCVYTKKISLEKHMFKLKEDEEKFAILFSQIDEQIESLIFDLNLLTEEDIIRQEVLDKIKHKYIWIGGYGVFDATGKILFSDPKYLPIKIDKILNVAQNKKDIFIYIVKEGRAKICILKPFFYRRKLVYLLSVFFDFSALASFYPESEKLMVTSTDRTILWEGQSANIRREIEKMELSSIINKHIKGKIKLKNKDIFFFVRYIGEGKIIYWTLLDSGKLNKGG